MANESLKTEESPVKCHHVHAYPSLCTHTSFLLQMTSFPFESGIHNSNSFQFAQQSAQGLLAEVYLSID